MRQTISIDLDSEYIKSVVEQLIKDKLEVNILVTKDSDGDHEIGVSLTWDGSRIDVCSDVIYIYDGNKK